MVPNWPKGPTYWHEGRRLMVSIPFTWNLPPVKRYLQLGAPSWDTAVVGGPAVKLMPEYLSGISNVAIGGECPGALQCVNPLATRTTTGCIRKCGFCGIGTGTIEHGGFTELTDWPDLPIICDNNLLAASLSHFDKVMDRLEKHTGVDFNQGLDTRLIHNHHAYRLSRLNKPIVRLALDSSNPVYKQKFQRVVWMLRRWGVKNLHCYALIAFNTGPDEAWDRCEFIEHHKAKAYPMWFHPLDALKWNSITKRQRELGWDKKEQRRIMGYYYQHRGTRPNLRIKNA